MVSFLTRLFGTDRLNLAEDVVQDTLCQALQVWSIHGPPANPSAWLMRAARNRAIDLIRRDNQLRYITADLAYLMKLREDHARAGPGSDEEAEDDQLRMMFSCCHPALSTKVQVTLILKTLCGFSVAEIASALLASEASVEKRLARARRLFRESRTLVEVADAPDTAARLEAVHQAVYLLFNEGYHASQSEKTVREELCYEALRLGLLLSRHPQGARPKTFALLALFCFNAARLAGRVDSDGLVIQLEHQDRSKWDRALIGKGFEFLEMAASRTEVSEFHVEAAIASLHSSAATYAATDWARIRDLYDVLYALKPTPIVALNRAIAVGQAQGPDSGVMELERIADRAALEGYPFYPAALGEFHRRAGRSGEARDCFKKALKLARNAAEARFLERRLTACAAQPGDSPSG